jgi:hypothetical protein
MLESLTVRLSRFYLGISAGSEVRYMKNTTTGKPESLYEMLLNRIPSTCSSANKSK